jgi:26S proteasome regulatory subunit N1
MSPKTDETVQKAKPEAPGAEGEKTDKEKPAKSDKNAEEDLSEEDKKLKEELELCVTRLQEPDQKLHAGALECMRKLIRASTTSMTSVPKPLKFMIPHYETMKAVYEKIASSTSPDAVKKECADVLSVLSMTMSENNECLKYKLKGDTSTENMDAWGHEYVRHLAGEIVAEWNDMTTETTEGQDEAMDDLDKKNELLHLVQQIIPSQMKHHAEAEACDLLMEVERLDYLEQYVDKTAFNRVCLYLTSCVAYVPEPENTNLLNTALNLFRKFDQYPHAMRIALQMNDPAKVQEIFLSCQDPIMQKQLAFMLGRHQHYLELDENEYDEIIEIMSNSHLNNHFLNLGRELDIMEAKTPEDVYKSHLDNVRPVFGGSNVDSARQNLASSFVNGFVNAGFGQDKLLMEDGQKWLYKNKDHGMMSATASIGLVLLWDVDGGLTQIDKYLYSPEDHIKAGALLACGIVNTGVRNDCDPALALLSDYVLHKSNVMRTGAIFGLGLAYAGSNRQDLISLLLPVFAEQNSTMEVIGVAALACGLISVGSCNDDVTTTILQTLMEKSAQDLKDPFAKYLPLGIGLCYLGKQEAAEVIVAGLEVLTDPFQSMAKTLVDICAYAGTGNVLKIQSLLHICSEHHEPAEKDETSSRKDKSSSKSSASNKEDKKEDKKKEEEEAAAKAEAVSKDLSTQQAVAVLGLALVAMGEDIGSEMLFRHFGHLLRYCEPVIRRAVPLALGLISVSNPQLNILDTLSKFSHDADPEVAHNSIFAMGLLGAGTNNARLAAMLRQLAQYHAKDSNNLFMVRIAQGLVHMGKGTLTLNPYHSDNQLLSPVSVAGLLGCILAFLDVKSTILGKAHYLLYALSTAIQPRMLVTFDEELRPLPVSVRVGQAVDVVGQAGKPKTITGFQTHTTPVLLSCGERAELATEEYLPVTPIMEGFVILKKNPDY